MTRSAPEYSNTHMEPGTHTPPTRTETTLWSLVVFSFLAAATSGVWLRYGFWNGFPNDLIFVNVRHAHSHLMFYSWVTPAGMLLLFKLVKHRGGDDAGKWIVPVGVLLGFLSFVPFMLSGYASTPIFNIRLPLSMILSGFVVLSWWVFGLFYFLNSHRIKRDVTQRYIDFALGLLLFSSLGAFSLAFAANGAFPAGLTQALVDFFIGLFSEGWLVLLVLIFALVRLQHQMSPGLQRVLVWAAAVFSISLPVRDGGKVLEVLGYTWLQPLTTTAQFLSGLTLFGMALVTAWYAQKYTLKILPLLFIGIKGIIDIGLAFPELQLWFDRNHLKVLMLHAYLLGAVSFALFLAARQPLMYGAKSLPRPHWFLVGIFLLLGSLVLLTGYAPSFFPAAWIRPATIIGSIAPIAGYALARIPCHTRE